MPVSSPTPLRVAVLADSDTRWKWGALTARRIAPESTVHGYLLWGRATPTERQLAEIGADADELREVSAADFLADLGKRAHGAADEAFDVLVLACVGGTIQAMLHGLARAWRTAERRPVVVTGYVGVVYEKLPDGLLLRHGADLVLANSRYDARRFRAVYEGVRADSGAVTECALPFLDGRAYDPGPARRGERPFRVVFAVQPSVPATRKDRAYLLDRAMEHARRFPDREVVLKLRSKPSEHTTHIEELPYQRLLERAKDEQPPNFRLAYGNMGEVLDETDLLVTVSSTAALESLHRSVPTAVLSDLGIREQLGNHYFIGSGCFASWDELDAGYLPEPESEWLADQGIATSHEHAFATARGRLAGLLDQRRQSGLLPLAPYYTVRTAPGYLPGVLARHGLDVKGEPKAGHQESGPDQAGMRAASRRLLRRTARGAYRAGVQRVAPLIRRWGQL
ncbi:DUF6716 putative glycosyltransferase [Streptomyces radicis]|uniref:Uncharacterized protein n=1 Tax=Streptomyces radicis TaxID=1750517 RepID=A0A3A9VWV7_9ACTN|nr:DUF6716 putative glycosyltransferase [Streptomyces radicis]RKN05229.1 hypothetical protein D7319_26025 [Streptomyces radicis]RKN16762.1 hypothetical protein D7318_25390 [Streptomyces radicis]